MKKIILTLACFSLSQVFCADSNNLEPIISKYKANLDLISQSDKFNKVDYEQIATEISLSRILLRHEKSELKFKSLSDENYIIVNQEQVILGYFYQMNICKDNLKGSSFIYIDTESSLEAIFTNMTRENC